jgi:hypothetical protein
LSIVDLVIVDLLDQRGIESTIGNQPIDNWTMSPSPLLPTPALGPASRE